MSYFSDLYAQMFPRATPEPGPHLSTAALVLGAQRAMHRQDVQNEIARRIAAREQPRWPRQLAMFKLDARCTHCGSHDYVRHHDTVKCAYCRIPAAKQPAHHAPYTPSMESMRAARREYYRGMLNSRG